MQTYISVSRKCTRKRMICLKSQSFGSEYLSGVFSFKDIMRNPYCNKLMPKVQDLY